MLQGVLGEKALQGSNVMVHPFLVAGWAGLVSTSLNLLPVGSIDGGRIVQVRSQHDTPQLPWTCAAVLVSATHDLVQWQVWIMSPCLNSSLRVY